MKEYTLEPQIVYSIIQLSGSARKVLPVRSHTRKGRKPAETLEMRGRYSPCALEYIRRI